MSIKAATEFHQHLGATTEALKAAIAAGDADRIALGLADLESLTADTTLVQAMEDNASPEIGLAAAYGGGA